MAAHTWQQAATVVAGMAVCWMAALLAEQTMALAVRRGLRRIRPMLQGPPVVRYVRSVFTPGSMELQAVHGLLCLSGIALWLGLAQHAALHAAAGLVWLAALVLDLWSQQSVEVDDWHVAWRRGAAAPVDTDGAAHRVAPQRPVRQLPLAQVALVHVVERPGTGAWARLAEQWGLLPGTAYLALAFHNGHAVKLPRTSRRFGLVAVRRMAAWIEEWQQRDAQARRAAAAAEAHAQARATRVDTDALAPVADTHPAEELQPIGRIEPLRPRVDDDAVIEVEATVVSKTGP